VPAEYSSGQRVRRGPITKAGSQPIRTALIEAAWAYRHKPAVTTALRRRQAEAKASPATLARSWQAQQRLHTRYLAMTRRGKPGGVITTAIARELAGFLWAEMTS
jgi:transposase